MTLCIRSCVRGVADIEMRAVTAGPGRSLLEKPHVGAAQVLVPSHAFSLDSPHLHLNENPKHDSSVLLRVDALQLGQRCARETLEHLDRQQRFASAMIVDDLLNNHLSSCEPDMRVRDG